MSGITIGGSGRSVLRALRRWRVLQPALRVMRRVGAFQSILRALRRANSRQQLRREFRTDARRFATHAADGQLLMSRMTASQLEAQLTKDYHVVEKGFSLPSPRRPFGLAVLDRLETLIPEAERQVPGAPFLNSAIRARDALLAWNSGDEIWEDVAPKRTAEFPGGPLDPEEFFDSRRSVRHFSPETVLPGDIERAITLASAAPSVCNRAPWRVRLFREAEASRVLQHQDGNRGFGETIPVVALVTVDLGLFTGPGERNQAWIEGGIFAGTLVWALHSIRLGTCMLNLSLVNEKADALRDAAQISEQEVPIVMIAIGHPAAEHRVAQSRRRSFGEIVRMPN